MSKVKLDKKNICKSSFKKMKKFTLQLHEINAQIGHIMGEVLTIIDASIPDKQQNKAVKDLIKNKVYFQLDWIRKLATNDYGDVVVGENDVVEEIDEKEVEKILTDKKDLSERDMKRV